MGGTWEAEEAPTFSQDCVEDSVTPIVLRLNFSLTGQPSPSFGNLRPVLAEDAQRLFTALVSPGVGTWKGPEAQIVDARLISFQRTLFQYFILLFHFTPFHYFLSFHFVIFYFLQLPFEKNCGNDTICQDNLSVTFSFMRRVSSHHCHLQASTETRCSALLSASAGAWLISCSGAVRGLPPPLLSLSNACACFPPEHACTGSPQTLTWLVPPTAWTHWWWAVPETSL